MKEILVSKKISTYYSDNDKGYCEVHFDFKEECAFIKYYDNTGKSFFTEDFPNKSIRQVENEAEDWALGYKKLHEEQPFKKYN